METQSGILINIGSEHSAQLQAWVDETDWLIIANQLETRSAIVALDKKSTLGGFSLCRLTEVPEERNRYRPHYGDSGGGFEYRFRTHPSGTQVIAQSSVFETYKKDLCPLELILPNSIETQVPAANYEIISADNSRFKEGWNQFGFRGKFFHIFHAWEWYSEDTHPFEFQFHPLSVGCVIRISHIESNTLLDLTKDVEW